MNFIKKIAVSGFESHEDTVLDDLSPGLNAIVGLSNSGKSAIVRALKLIAYNEFDPQSVRNGCDNCEVQVWTDNGNVKVTRGKKNLWEVTDRAGKTSYFDKIGKQILPQVTEILGFGLVKLGDIEMQANIMDQLEAHFMLAEFSGQDATGSLRAQVVDEISGLSGIEGLIRDVSLDNSRLTREINQIEDRNREIAGQLHDANALAAEEDVLKKVSEAIKTHDENQEAVVLLKGLQDSHRKEAGEVGRLTQELSGLPDEKHARTILLAAEKFANDAMSMKETYDEWKTVDGQVKTLTGIVSKLPDERKARGGIASAEAAITKAKGMSTLNAQAGTECAKIAQLRKELHQIPDAKRAQSLLEQASEKLGQAEDAANFIDEWLEAKTAVAEDADFKNETEAAYITAAEEYNNALSQVDVCPVTMKPISGECMKGVRIPVVRPEDATRVIQEKT